MSSIAEKTLSWFYNRAAIPLAFGVAGYAINCMPIEIFPGIHLIFGSIASIIAAMKFGPYVGGVAGLVAGLRTWSLWNQPLPFSACLYALESVWVGHLSKRGKWAPLTTIFLYWLLLGAWLNLAGQLLLHGLPLRLALIVQARSVINGMLTSLLLESGILIYEIIRRRRARAEDRPAQLSLNSLVTLVMAATITLPLLYITTNSILNVREKMMSDLKASSMRDVAAVETEVRALVRDHERGLLFAASLFTSPRHRTGNSAGMSSLLANIHEEFPDFQAMYIADADGRIIASVPEYNLKGQRLVGTDLSDRPFYRDLLRTKATVYSDVYYEQDVMTGPALAAARPLLDKDGNVMGFVLACMSTKNFHSILSRHREEGETLIIADRAGCLIAESSRPTDEYYSLIGQKDFEIASQNSDGIGSYSDSIGDVRSAASAALDDTYLVQYTTLPVAGWKIWERQSLRPLKAKLDGFYVNYLMVLVLALIVAFVFSKAVARLFTKPITQLQASASRMTTGNLSEPQSSRRLLTAEYDSLFRSFTEMSERLEEGWARQKELLREVSIAKRELEATFDAMTDAVIITDTEDRVLRANRAYYKLTGHEAEHIIGCVLTEVVHQGDDWRQCGSCTARREGRHAIIVKAAADNPTGRQLEIRVDPICNLAGERVGAVQVLHDVTEKRLEVEQGMREDKLRALGQLASGVAHNFNNSLTAVLGYTQLVLGRVSDPKVTRHLKTVETAALDAAKMVQRIQNFARQRHDEPSCPSDLNQIIRDALDLTRSRWRDDARATGTVYDIAFNPAGELVAMCDQSAMREVFVNIIINALDAMVVGGRLQITTVVEGDRGVIKFADTGCGMTEQVRQRIFEPFYTTKGAKGYGMGLAVTYGIVERHGGSIQVASEAGHGATFTIRLPLARAEQREQDEMLPDISPKEASILVVDDEAPIRVLLRDILRARGHKVLIAEDGLAALKAIESRRFDMVITDLSMPGVDGWTIASEARRRWPATKLVIVTGYGGFAEMEVQGGDTSLIDALISKPFNIAQIDATISKLLLTIKQVA